VFAATAVLDLVAPATLVGDRAHTASDYAFIALLIPFALAAAWMAEALHGWHAGRDGRSGRVGARLVGVGAAGFVVSAIASLITGDDRAIAPVYPLSMLLTLVGFVALAVGWARAGLLPVWAGPLLVVAWLVGGPVAVGHGLFLILAAVSLILAYLVSARTATAG
jgi:hypothetical protein